MNLPVKQLTFQWADDPNGCATRLCTSGQNMIKHEHVDQLLHNTRKTIAGHFPVCVLFAHDTIDIVKYIREISFDNIWLKFLY